MHFAVLVEVDQWFEMSSGMLMGPHVRLLVAVAENSICLPIGGTL
jgi:hypothetical protein